MKSRPATNATGPDTRPVRRLPAWKKLLYSVAAAVLLFALGELILAFAGVRPLLATRDPFVGFAENIPLFVAQRGENGTGTMMVTAPNKLAFFNHQQFAANKAPGVFRIFCLGGSTTYGRPYDDTTSFCGWLRVMLPEVVPETDWEVINAGGISYASYRVAAVMDELTQYEPDLFIVYTGQNEFLEERTYAAVREMPELEKGLTTTLARLRTYTLLHDLLAGSSPLGPERRELLPAEVDAVLDHSVGPSAYHRDDALRKQIIRHFELNLQRMARIARDARVPLLLITPASNLKDCSPFKSEHSANLSPARLEQWKMHYEAAQKRELEGWPTEALDEYRKAVHIDGRFAELHYRMGKVLLKLKRYRDADEALRKAIDEDVCPLRAVREIPAAVRRAARTFQLPLVDFEQLVREQSELESGSPSAGREYFLDHVHPTIDVHGGLAAAIVGELTEREIIDRGRTLDEGLFERVRERIHQRVDRTARAVALRNLAKVLNWAGKHLEAGSLALEAVEQLPDDPESLALSAAYLKETGRVEQAIDHYQRALVQQPDYADARQLLGALLVEQKRLGEARAHFEVLTRLRPEDAEAWQMVGAILAEQQRFAEALPYYRESLRRRPDSSDAHYNLGLALVNTGERAEAIEHFQKAIELDPDDADAHHNLATLLAREGKHAAAAAHFRQVLRLRPDDEPAKRQLEKIGQQRKAGAAQ